MKSNVIAAAIVGLIFGVVVEFFFTFIDRIPIINLLVSLIALLFGFGLPMLIGAMAAAWSSDSPGLLATPAGTFDGALAALLAELTSRLIGFCANIFSARPFFPGPRFLLPSIGPAIGAVYSGVWAIGWFFVSLIIAALLGALGGFLYNAFGRR